MNFHDSKTRTIALNPKVLNLDNIVLSTGEVQIFGKNGNIISQPDNLLFDPSTKILYSVEYKSSNRKNHAKKQLKTRYWKLNDVFRDYRVVNMYVHNNFEIEVVK